MTKLAKEFGLSDVGLAKVCKRYEIPRPGVGYWTKQRLGKRVKKKRLPKVDDQSLETIRITVVDKLDDGQVVDERIAKLILDEKRPESVIVVSDELRVRHPYLSATKKALSGAKPDEFGRIIPSARAERPHFDVQVSRKSQQRALRIVQAFVSALKQRGYPLLGQNDKGNGPYFEIEGSSFQLSIWEPAKQRENPKYLEEERRRRQRKKRYEYDYFWNSQNRFEYVPSEKLEFRIHNGGGWQLFAVRDTEKRKLEDKLNKVFIDIFKWVDRSRIESEIAQRKAVLKEERKQLAIEREIERRSDSERILALAEFAERHAEYERLRMAVDAVRREAANRLATSDPDTTAWLEWAEDYLEKINPLASNLPLPGYGLTEKQVERLRHECMNDWSDYFENFRESAGNRATSAYGLVGRKPR